ncbi:MAG: acyl-CoA dehydrogenase family protein [Candidatus Lambdaproteobacteria bacterium]|nr:acyl-CoA dehydrogenase family protein [Candidatus Lambdaproteobacteria bacterium]
MNWHDHHDAEVMEMIGSVRTFLDRSVAPLYKTHEREGRFPDALVPQLADMGLLGLTIPKEYGGLGRGVLLASLVARELAYAWGSLHLIWTADTSLAAFPILHAGNRRQKEAYLPRLASGEMLGCYALTEPDSGSDAAAMKTRAARKKDGWVLNGSKTFITNALHASVAVVFARTGAGPHDISAFLVESETPGLALPGLTVKRIDKHVLRSSDFCELSFEDVVVPDGALLGGINTGFGIAMSTLDRGRINIAAQAAGLAARVFDDAFAYVTKVRSQFGRMVWENQAVQFDFADAYASLLAAWSLVERTSIHVDAGHPAGLMASATKLFATVECKKVAFSIGEYFGGSLVTSDTDALMRMLDLVPVPIYEGTSNIQRIVIARQLQE